MHLSFPEGGSVNDGISVQDFPLKYITVSDAMDAVMALGRGALMAKIDIKHAFRLCPVRPEDQPLLGMCWDGHFYFPSDFARLPISLTAYQKQWSGLQRTGELR